VDPGRLLGWILVATVLLLLISFGIIYADVVQ
jgi:hypothetical protein